MTDLHSLFTQHFGATDDCFAVRSPGRVNLVGGHIDYNAGLVLPMAIPMSTQLLVRPRHDRTVELYSDKFDTKLSFSLDHIEKNHDWLDYIKGVARELASAQVPLHGFEGVITSDIPTASGLSSSASLEVAAALTFLHLAQQPMSTADIALLCQRAENKFVGVNCGIMDQMSIAAGRKDHALLLDCRSLEIQHIPFKLENHSIVITNSGAPRELASSAYNERRAQSEESLKILQKHLPLIEALRDVSVAQFEQLEHELPTVLRKRVRHVVTEIERVIQATQALQVNNLSEFGRCMNESHNSLRDNYEVSSRQLDWLVDWSRAQSGVLGARLTGAGFGGCIVALVENSALDSYINHLPQEYFESMQLKAQSWICTAAAGAAVQHTLHHS